MTKQQRTKKAEKFVFNRILNALLAGKKEVIVPWIPSLEDKLSKFGGQVFPITGSPFKEEVLIKFNYK